MEKEGKRQDFGLSEERTVVACLAAISLNPDLQSRESRIARCVLSFVSRLLDSVRTCRVPVDI